MIRAPFSWFTQDILFECNTKSHLSYLSKFYLLSFNFILFFDKLSFIFFTLENIIINSIIMELQNKTICLFILTIKHQPCLKDKIGYKFDNKPKIIQLRIICRISSIHILYEFSNTKFSKLYAAILSFLPMWVLCKWASRLMQ